jgi:hypothetical protein
MIKKSFLILPALLLCLGVAGCKEKEMTEKKGNVTYVACIYESGYIDTTNIKGEAYLFQDSIPAAIKMAFHLKWDELPQAWIVYDSERDSAVLYVESVQVWSTNSICNYPLFAKKWHIPDEGKKVYYEGTAYTMGRYFGVPSIDGNNLVLTILKEK